MYLDSSKYISKESSKKRGKKGKKRKGKHRVESDEEITSRPVVDTTSGELPEVSLC